MPIAIQRWLTGILAGLCVLMLTLIYADKAPPDFSFFNSAPVATFKTLFISIILEALPFVLLGVLLSALLQTFVSESAIRRLIPQHPVPGVLLACLIGIVFPLCECGMIPVIRRLLRKGVPVYFAAVMIVAGPIINPVVYASTYMAFRSSPDMAYARMGLAFAASATIGLLIFRWVKGSPLREASAAGPHAEHGTAVTPFQPAGRCAHHEDAPGDTDRGGHIHRAPDQFPGTAVNADSSGADTDGGYRKGHAESRVAQENRDVSSTSHEGSSRPTLRVFGRLQETLGHASDEFFEMGKYLIFGAMLTAVIQTVVDRESLVAVGHSPLTSHLFMMGLAFIMSICSTSDAFVASSFASLIPKGALLTFLVFGPMLDLKGLLMLLSAFRVKFVLLLSGLITVVTLTVSLLYERWFLL